MTNGAPLTAVPTLDELVSDPAKATELSPAVAQKLLIELTSLQPMLIAQSLRVVETASEQPEKWMTVAEAAAQFGVTPVWLYRHKRQLPHSQPSRKVLLFPEERLRRWFAGRKTT